MSRCVEEGRWVVVGDDRGDVHLLRFPHTTAGLLTRPRSEGLTALTWQVSILPHPQHQTHATLHIITLLHHVLLTLLRTTSLKAYLTQERKKFFIDLHLTFPLP